MDSSRVQDRISYGMGKAAQKLGLSYIVYRPQGAFAPLSTQNRVIKLCASFNAEDASYRRVSGYGSAVWWGVFDASYTRPGDYLVSGATTFFVSAQRPALPVQCVRTNRVVDVARAGSPVELGYAGQVDAVSTPIIGGWPASILAAGSRAAIGTTVERYGYWIILLPQLPIALQPGDLLTDDMGMRYAVGSAELSDLGWRIVVRQIIG